MNSGELKRAKRFGLNSCCFSELLAPPRPRPVLPSGVEVLGDIIANHNWPLREQVLIGVVEGLHGLGVQKIGTKVLLPLLKIVGTLAVFGKVLRMQKCKMKGMDGI